MKQQKYCSDKYLKKLELNRKKIIKRIYRFGYGVACKKLSICRNITSRHIKHTNSDTYMKLKEHARGINRKTSKNTFEEDAKYCYLKIGNKVCIFNIKFKKKVLAYSWCLSNGYPQANIKNKRVTMHIYLFGRKNGLVIDHITRNKLDNRWKNIRFVTQSVNIANREPTSNTGARGCFYVPSINKKNSYTATLRSNNIVHNLGYFNLLGDAIAAREKAEVDILGFKIDNVPHEN